MTSTLGAHVSGTTGNKILEKEKIRKYLKIVGTRNQKLQGISLPPGDGILWFHGHGSGCLRGCWSQNWIVIFVYVHGLLTSLWFLCIIYCFGSEKMEFLLLKIFYI